MPSNLLFPRIIGLCGVAKSGKDTFCKTLQRIRPGGIRISIGDIIRQDCDAFIREALGLDVNRCTSDEKEFIRPILVGYGIAKRKVTKGAYFRDMLDIMMAVHSSSPLFDPAVNYFIMTDLRFAEYVYDEPEWIKSHGGIIVHISRIIDYSQKPSTWNMFYHPELEPNFILPPNVTEWENDPRLQAKADYKVQWETRDDQTYFELHVNNLLAWIENNWDKQKSS